MPCLTDGRSDAVTDYSNLRKLVHEQVPELNGDITKADAGTFPSLLSNADEILVASRNLLAHYDRLRRESATQKTPDVGELQSEWHNDKNEVERLMAVGKMVTKQRLDKMLPKGAMTVTESPTTVQPLSSPTKAAAQLFDPHRAVDDRLPQAFVHMTRGISRFAKQIPKV